MTTHASWPTPTAHRLDNGLEIVSVELPHLHTAHAILMLRVGSRFEGEDDGGLSHLLEHVLFRGCEAYPSTWALNSAFEACSTGLDAATSRDYTTFETAFSPAELERVLELLGAMLSKPLLTDVELEKKVIAEELQDEIDSLGDDIDVDNLAKMALFPGPGFGAKIGGRLEDVAEYTREDCVRWFRRFYGASNMVLAVAGPMSAERVHDAARHALSVLPRGKRQVPPKAHPRADLPAFEFKGHVASQTEIQLAWELPPEPHEDWPALLLAQRLLDDGSCARVRHRVVDQLGLAYHASAELELYSGLSVLSVETQTQKKSVLRAIDELLAVVRGLATEPATAEELARVRGRLGFELSSVRDSPANVAYWFGLQRLYDGADGLADRADRLARVTPEAVQDVARRYLAERRMQLTVVGDLTVLDRAALRRRLHRIREQRPQQDEGREVRLGS